MYSHTHILAFWAVFCDGCLCSPWLLHYSLHSQPSVATTFPSVSARFPSFLSLPNPTSFLTVDCKGTPGITTMSKPLTWHSLHEKE